MSFSQQVKNELLKIEYDSTCCEKAFLYGMCIFGKSFSSYGVGVQTENKDIAIRYAFLIKNIAILNAMLRLHRAVKATQL